MSDTHREHVENSISQVEDVNIAPEEHPPKRQKRGRYVSKACDECQKRKIKCDGRLPCRACTLKGRECNRQTTDMRRRGLTVPDEALERSHSPGDQDKENPTTKELAVRLDRIENQLSSLVSSISRGLGGLNGSTSEPLSPQDHRTNHGPRSLGSSSIKSPPKSSVPMFSGETSIAHTLDQVENHLAHIGGDENRHSAATSQTAKTSFPPSPIPRGEVDDENHEQIYIRQVLNDFDIEPDRQCWDEFLDTFCEEVHILYPMLHLPTLRLTYTNMWGKHLLSPECELGRDDSRFSIAQTWICLAIGRCTQSARIHGEDGRHSAGWSLYDAAMHLIGDLLSSFQECSSPKLILQTLVLIVIYLFRLDANESAEKVLALAVTHSHNLGIHRRKVVEGISAFNSEMVRRVWWCIYLMDRRLAIDTGHPFLIQDVNVDTPLPRELSDDWLTRYRDDPSTNHEVEPDIQAEVARAALTAVSYLNAMISYSRSVGRVWEGMYGVGRTETAPSPLLRESSEQHIARAQKEIQPEFLQDYNKPLNWKLSNAPWWRTKQRMLMHIRWYSIQLLIRKPMLQRAVSPSSPISDSPENEVTCMHIAQNMIQGLTKFPKERVRSTFTFLHYFVSATMISMGLIIKEPSFKAAYGNATLQAAMMLRTYCRQTWISGRMVRSIYRLNQMATRVLSDYSSRPSSREVNEARKPALTNRPSKQPYFAPDMHPQQNTSYSFGNAPDSRQAPEATENTQDQQIRFPNNPLDYPTNTGLHDLSAFEDIWNPEITNIVMGDFDFEETTASNLNQTFPSDAYGINPAWTQTTTAPTFAVPDVESARPLNAQTAFISDAPTGISQDVQATGESGMEIDWLQSLFWDSVGSYS
ncbi:hypothetical protein SI65_07461 [Aspergillus cristatus]|uniref:Zn(2)-C6 fungal-type domain-containing protein n=1 Tax=Aspergillus cristatus TaxID=573508 RepID=A0A1E3B7X3_ASPCR|nr:hypothetical protein SI65_07461 [Aspergillus cristatus]